MIAAALAPRRTRKSPEARRAQICTVAARVVLEEGISAITMERIARETGISKALVYNYFATRDHLLAALLRREQTELRERGIGAALRAETFPELIRQTTRVYLEQVQHRGALIAALLSDPSVGRLMEEDGRADRERTRQFFVKQVVQVYALPEALAAPSVDLLWAVTDAAGRALSQHELSIDEAEELCVQLITGGLERLSKTSKRRPKGG